MGLQIKPTGEESSTSLIVYDCTGTFASDNPGGYGGSNYSKGRIQSSLLEILGPSDTDYHEFDVTGMLPNTEGLGYEILPSMMGQSGDIIESGKYKLRLSHVILKEDDVSTTTITGYGVCVLTNSIKCCIDKLELDPSQNAFQNPKQKQILELKNLLEGVDSNIESGFYDKADTTIDYLKAQCICTEC